MKKMLTWLSSLLPKKEVSIVIVDLSGQEYDYFVLTENVDAFIESTQLIYELSPERHSVRLGRIQVKKTNRLPDEFSQQPHSVLISGSLRYDTRSSLILTPKS